MPLLLTYTAPRLLTWPGVVNACPCGCGAILQGRQKSASPACRKRLERQRRPKCDASHFEPESDLAPARTTDLWGRPLVSFEASPFHWPIERRDFASADYDPMRDMTLQPAFCVFCGGVNRKSGAYIYCTLNDRHWQFQECVGATDHPRNSDWEAYIALNGGHSARDAAIERMLAARRLRW